MNLFFLFVGSSCSGFSYNFGRLFAVHHAAVDEQPAQITHKHIDHCPDGKTLVLGDNLIVAPNDKITVHHHQTEEQRVDPGRQWGWSFFGLHAKQKVKGIHVYLLAV